MTRLKTLQPRLKVMNTQRLKPLISETKRIGGNARYSLKRSIYVRDGCHCCMCQTVVDLHDSELDHRIALQFGGDNSRANLWTLCIPCHAGKTAREMSTAQADEVAMRYSVPDESENNITII